MDNKPTILTTGEIVKQSKKWYQTWRIIYPILGIVVVVELILGLKTLLDPLPQISKHQAQNLLPTKGGEITLNSSQANFKVGEKVTVTINVSTGGYTIIGTDLVLRFNPKAMETSSADFIRGKIYSEYPLISVDNKDGVVRVSAVATNADQGFNGIGELGVINFKTKAAGQVNIIVDFKKGSTTDSNIIRTKTSEDVLGSVTNLNLTIK